MSTFNPLPYSNQFERGHSFNWAGKWKTNTHYLNDEYVTDFVVHNSCILACRTNHLSTSAPEIVISDGKAVDVNSPYWLFIVDCMKDNPVEISTMFYDEQTGKLRINYIDGRYDEFQIDIKISDSTIHIGSTPPENDNKIWIDTTDQIEKQVNTEPDIIASIQQAVYTMQRQLASLMKIRVSGVVPGNITDGTLTELGNSADPLIPEIIREDYEQAIIDGDIDPTQDQDFPQYATDAEPTVNHVAIKMGTYAEIQNSRRFFINGELVWCTDKRNMYIFDNGVFYLVAGSSNPSPSDDTMDKTELQNYLDNLSSISFVPLNDSDSTYTVRVNEYGNLIVYDKNNDVVQPSPTTDDIMFNNSTLGSIIINSFYLGGLDTDEHSYQPCSHNFVEIANISTNDINLNGLVLMYTYDNTQWYKLPLWGVCKAGSTFLVRGAQCSVMDVNTTMIKVKSFDMEWRTNNGLIKFDRSNQSAAFYIAWYNQETGEIYTRDLNGLGEHPTKEYPTSVLDLISTDEPGSVARGYVDLVGVGGSAFFEKNVYPVQGGITSNTLFRRTYTLDPTSQSNAKGITKRNNKKYWYHIDITKHLVDNVEDYTPKASYEHKNLSFDKHNFREDEPNTITCNFGIQATDNTASGGNGATRCFNWNSVGYYDEYLWYKKSTDSSWTKVESYKDGVDYTTSGLNRSTDPACIKQGLSEYYTRIRWETFYGAPITTHKVMIAGLTAGTYQYKVGRADSEGNPTDYISKTRTFTVKTDSAATSFDFIQTTDQQGANWEEYQTWDLSADFINRNERVGQTPVMPDGVASPGPNATDFDFTINTGDICYNGSRPNEWIDYYRGYSYIDDKEEMFCIGNNDLAPVPSDLTVAANPTLYGMTLLGNGSEVPYKVNHVVADLFYTQEMDYNNPPIFEEEALNSSARKTFKVPSLYSFNYGPYHFICLNSEIRTMPDAEGNTTLRGEFGVKDVSTGARKSKIYDQIEDWLVKDLLIWKNGSVPQDYTRYTPQNCQKAFIYCHEMPFTITATNTYRSENNDGTGYLDPTSSGSIWREKSKANLNLRHNFEFQRLFKIWGIRLVFGGHKHTCSISYPIYDAPTNYVPYTSTDQDLMGDLVSGDTFNPIMQVVRTSNETKHGLQDKMNTILTDFLSKRGNIFNSTNTAVTVNGTTFDAKSTTTSSVEKPLVRVEIVDDVSAPTYVMCQATGYKNLSNSDTSASEEYCQWLRDFVPNGGTEQLYTFYTRFKVSENEINVSMDRVGGMYTPSSKAGYWDVNRDMPNGHEDKMNSLYRKHWADCVIPLT